MQPMNTKFGHFSLESHSRWNSLDIVRFSRDHYTYVDEKPPDNTYVLTARISAAEVARMRQDWRRLKTAKSVGDRQSWRIRATSAAVALIRFEDFRALGQFENITPSSICTSETFKISCRTFSCTLCSYVTGLKGVFQILPTINFPECMAQRTSKPLKKFSRYCCPFCQYSTICSTVFKRHMMTHTGEKPFQCEICGRGFTTKQRKNHHLTTHKELGFH
ncbi:hypothetical protein AVEN_162803-1 [Araneus ventricosus]|uniref:C2H2-type domain-containing protein n=1 Tax=Araneus ventricosus TaxID=182803 RepID=A0A4Y2C616_ARAVE|nr:hypothetical protein AVEN_162803-1 [Araneus ventricosus]